MDKERLEIFVSCYNRHYKEILERLTDLNICSYGILNEKDRRLLAFLKEDLEELFGDNTSEEDVFESNFVDLGD